MEKVKIIAKQFGGKATLAKWIVSYFPEHRIYCEPFVGSAAVLFAKERSFIEIINDLDGRIINVFEQLRANPEQLSALLWATPYSYANWREQNNYTDKLEEARLYIAEKFQFYCGNTNTSTWSIDKNPGKHKPKPETFADYFLRIMPAANRLRSCIILNEDALKVINRVYQQEDCLMYVDPPYMFHEKDYSYQVNYEEMVKLLHEAKCKVIVSELAIAEKYFPNWRKVEKEMCIRTCSPVHKTKSKINKEVLYMNFDAPQS